MGNRSFLNLYTLSKIYNYVEFKITNWRLGYDKPVNHDIMYVKN